MEAFAAAALDYLVKPVNPERLTETLRRVKRFADLQRLRHHETPTEKYKRKAQQRRRRR